jgi:BASS family bile acid:Na+ symporter
LHPPDRAPAHTRDTERLSSRLSRALGYLGSRALGLAPAQRRAVSLETGIQNAPLAIVLLSFPAEIATDVLVAPLLYGVIVVPFSAALALGFRRMSSAPGR